MPRRGNSHARFTLADALGPLPLDPFPALVPALRAARARARAWNRVILVRGGRLWVVRPNLQVRVYPPPAPD